MIDNDIIVERISEPLFQNFKRIYLEMTQIEINLVDTDSVNSEAFDSFYTATMGVNGDIIVDGESHPLEGGLIISWSKSSYLKMCSAMLGEEFTDISEDLDDVGLEVLNVTVGNSKRELSERNIKLSMSLPVSTIGEGHKIDTFNNIPKSKYTIKTSAEDLVSLSFFFTQPDLNKKKFNF